MTIPNADVNQTSGASSSGESGSFSEPSFEDFSTKMESFHNEPEITETTAEETADEPVTELTPEGEPAEELPAEEGEAAEEPAADKQSRSGKFKELTDRAEKLDADLQAITTERDALNQTIQTFEQTVEKYGGIDKFQEFEETFSQIINPTEPGAALEAISQLPHGAQIRSEIMFDSLGIDMTGKAKELAPDALNIAINNQATVLNSILRTYQGVDPSLKSDDMEMLGSYLAHRFENDRETFLTEMRDTVEDTIDPKDRQIRELQNQLQTKPADAAQPPAEQAAQPDPFQDITRVAASLQEFHNEAAGNELATLADKYKLADGDKNLPASMQTANAKIREIISVYLLSQMKDTPAQANLATFLRKADKNYPTFFLSANPYKSALKANAEKLLKEISPRLNGVAAASPAPPPPKEAAQDPTGTTTTIEQQPKKETHGNWEDFPSSGKY